MECFGTTNFDKNSRLITLSPIIISGLHRISKFCNLLFSLHTHLNNFILIYVTIMADVWKVWDVI
jgi:hypothetical protein